MNLIGIRKEQVNKTKQPDKTLETLLKEQPSDTLLQALHALFNQLLRRSNLSRTDFGVFGSLLHGFYHPKFSDIDLTIYGRDQLKQLKEVLGTFYKEEKPVLGNEFDAMKSVKGKHWKFQNYSLKEYIWHQKRKQVYALFHYKESGRIIKVEFEPVKRWEEIQNEYDPSVRITRKGWIKLSARITQDKDAPFMPSIYQIEPLKILKGERIDHIERIISFVEEFRMQAQRDELVIVEGNLEQVRIPGKVFHQITLTYGPKYYQQTLKILEQ